MTTIDDFNFDQDDIATLSTQAIDKVNAHYAQFGHELIANSNDHIRPIIQIQAGAHVVLIDYDSTTKTRKDRELSIQVIQIDGQATRFDLFVK